jgi:protein-L-isoaspartate(D-aspartate) O-methyltransferase
MGGLPEAAPFDSIIVAAAGVNIPQSLRDQLASGGRLIMPVGSGDQVLCMIERTPQGWVETHFDAVRFVPLLPGVG